MNKRKIILLAVALFTVAILAIGGTLAYFTDTDYEKNTFTIGNVQIDLIESQYHRVNAGKGYITEAEPLQGGYLWASNVDLQGNSENTPDALNYTWKGGYFSDAQIEEDAKTYKTGYFAENSVNMVPGNNVRKNPYIKNTGINDAYVRLRVWVPKDLFWILDKGASYWTDTALADGITSKAVAAYNAKNMDAVRVINADGVDYYEFDFVYEKKLAPGALTFWNVWGNIAIDPFATNADLDKVKTFDVIFNADAIQADGFANGSEAFEAFDAQTVRGNIYSEDKYTADYTEGAQPGQQ